jgi:membrane peptidoglycan carboxypeptidase
MQQLVPYYGSVELFGGGLKVYTSIDLELQKIAREAIDKWLPDRKGPGAALVAIDPRDGRVLAMVGGDSFEKSQFNLAVQGQRQTGSAFKPFVLTTAVEQGISPQTVFTSEPTVINLGDKLWSVGNYEGSYLGPIDVAEATIHSDNSVYAQLTAQVGPKSVASTAHKLGVTRPLDDYFAIGLGVEAVSPLEMARAFATLANGGERIDGSVLGNVPRAVLRVENGRWADSNDPLEKRVVDSNNTAIVNSILQRVVTEGTGVRAALDDRPVAGKTGTTENYGDAWFVGYTPQLAVAVWIGYPDKLKPMETEFEGDPVAGGTFPALIWKTFAEKALDYLDEPPESFPYPSYDAVVARQVVYRDDETQLDNGNCRETRQILYFVGTGPENEADCKPNEVDVPSVVGMRLADAKDRLYSMPLTAEVIWRPARAGQRLGRVIGQRPDSGTLSSWSTVRIVLPRATNGRVPDLVGMDIDDASRRLAKRTLTLKQSYVDGGKAGVVLAQFPRSGLAATRNMTVRLVVGTG